MIGRRKAKDRSAKHSRCDYIKTARMYRKTKKDDLRSISEEEKEDRKIGLHSCLFPSADSGNSKKNSSKRPQIDLSGILPLKRIAPEYGTKIKTLNDPLQDKRKKLGSLGSPNF